MTSKVLNAIALFERKAKENEPIIKEINRRNIRNKGNSSEDKKAKRSSIELNEEIESTINQTVSQVVVNKRFSTYGQSEQPLNAYERPFRSPPPKQRPSPPSKAQPISTQVQTPQKTPIQQTTSPKPNTSVSATTKPSQPSINPNRKLPEIKPNADGKSLSPEKPQTDQSVAPPAPLNSSSSQSSIPTSRPLPPPNLSQSLSSIRTIPQTPAVSSPPRSFPVNPPPKTVSPRTNSPTTNRPPVSQTLNTKVVTQKPISMPEIPKSPVVGRKEIIQNSLAKKPDPNISAITKDPKHKTSEPSSGKDPKKGGDVRGRPREDRLTAHLRELQNDYGVSTRALFISLIAENEKESASSSSIDKWSTKPEEKYDWKEIEIPPTNVTAEIRSLLNIDRAQAEGFKFEFGKAKIPYSSKVDIANKESNIPFYSEYLYKKENIVYYLSRGAGEGVGPICIVYENSPGSETDAKALILTKKGNLRFMVPHKFCSSSKEIFKYIKNEHKDLLADAKLTKIEDISVISEKLLEFERQDIVNRYKFGLLYVREGQTNESDMFSNGGNDTPSEDYEEFLDFIGEKIKLEGWSKFKGGLDVKANTTGTHSVYTEHKGFEIMFHVSTLLPFQANDLQRVERKRHLGNDIVVVIFKEGNTPFDPLCLTSHFNHIFVVIQPTKINNKTNYRVAIANKMGTPPYAPFLKSPPIYEKNNQFREFLLTKLINSERAAMSAPDFKGKMMRTRKTLLDSYADEILGGKGKKPAKTKVGSLVISSAKEELPTNKSATFMGVSFPNYVDLKELSYFPPSEPKTQIPTPSSNPTPTTETSVKHDEGADYEESERNEDHNEERYDDYNEEHYNEYNEEEEYCDDYNEDGY